MQIQLFVNDLLSGYWYFEDDTRDLVDKLSTEARKKLWDERMADCWKRVYETYSGPYDVFRMVVVVRSRFNPRDIPDKEYARFNQLLANRLVGKIVAEHKPELKNDKIE